jgi:hypothetical protein
MRAPDSVVASAEKANLNASHPMHVVRRCDILECGRVCAEMLWLCGTHAREMAYEIGMHTVKEVAEAGVCCIIEVCMAPASAKWHVESVAYD